ncbi:MULTISPECIES: fimbrial protein [Rahnella]|uniref:MrfF n=1 Tax=Rahnella laticis TaxID=2787622 RepID=A0ABS0E8Y5_9GAMM|nr:MULTISPECIES: fimbrial protein [Rahnella]MBF7981214.1 MrfF [Rahnella laticis]MBF8001306.1 MrfF [Rahnella sp. LAC-M12]
MNKTKAGMLFAVVTLLTPVFGVQAAPGNTGDNDSMDINITGTVVANGSCTFNQGGTLNVDFGEVKLMASGTDTVELSGNYSKPLVSDFFCDGDTEGLLQMKFTSTSGSYETYQGAQVLAADKAFIGIELLVNGAPQNMGEWFTIDQNAAPALKAQLVQLNTTTSESIVSGDVFTASGTLTMAFN